MFEGYFIGLKEGAILRNAAITAFGLGFTPLIVAAWYWQNVDFLWLSLIMYMGTLVLYLGRKMLKVQQSLIVELAK